MNNERLLKAAIIWINDMANPNEGMIHPLDDDKLKSIANLMANLEIEINDEIIHQEANSLGIIYDSITHIVNTFKNAKIRRFDTMSRFPEDFLKMRLIDIANEKSL